MIMSRRARGGESSKGQRTKAMKEEGEEEEEEEEAEEEEEEGAYVLFGHLFPSSSSPSAIKAIA